MTRRSHFLFCVSDKLSRRKTGGGLFVFNFQILRANARCGPVSPERQTLEPPTPSIPLLTSCLFQFASDRMLVVEVRSEGHGRGVPTLAHRVLPMSSAIACWRSQARRFGPAGCAWPLLQLRLLATTPRRRRPPSRLRPGCALAASHSEHTRSALPDRPAAAVCADQRNSKGFMH
jgi:hypothetical protein